MIRIVARGAWMALLAGVSCSDQDHGSSKSSSARSRGVGSQPGKLSKSAVVVQSSKTEFGKGYADGHRDALRSLFESHPGWMWLWAKPADYRQGYDRGWSDGRMVKKLQESRVRQAPSLTGKSRQPE